MIDWREGDAAAIVREGVQAAHPWLDLTDVEPTTPVLAKMYLAPTPPTEGMRQGDVWIEVATNHAYRYVRNPWDPLAPLEWILWSRRVR